MYISKDKCLACKLFSAPLFFLFGAFYSNKNFKYHLNNGPSPLPMKAFLIAIPLVLYTGGLVNTYQAYYIFKDYRQQEELWAMMDKEGVFEGKDMREC